MPQILARARALAKTPGFSVMVVAILAVGIGVSTALFSVVDAILLEPLAFHEPGRIVAIHTAWPAKGRVSPRITGGDFVDLRAASKSFSTVAQYAGGEIGLELKGQSRFARTFWTGPEFFHVLDVKPVAGRLPQKTDAEHTAIVTTSFANAAWGNPPQALGKVIRGDNKPYEVIGIVDDRYAFPERGQVWLTGPFNPENRDHTAFNYYAVGRLQPGVSAAQAQLELKAVGDRILKYEPGKTFRLLSLQENIIGSARPTLWFLFAATGLLLFIACTNVANLMLTRTADRAREVAVRFSLGSSLPQMIRMLAVESMILSGLAAVLGLGIAWGAVRTMHPLLPASIPRASEVLHLHSAVVLFASLAACLPVLACSIIPALQLRRVDIAEVLKQAPGRGITGGGTRARGLFVAAQVAFCCVLCVGAVLLARTLVALEQAPLGFNPKGVMVMYADAPAFQMPDYMRAIRTFEAALNEIRTIPGVSSAAAAMGLPTGKYGSNGSYLVEGVHIQPGQDPFKADWSRSLPEAIFSLASEQYFQTTGIPMLAGRNFDARDQINSPFTAIVNQSLAKQSFGNSNPIGRRLYCGLDSPNPMTIVGVVGDVRQDSPSSPPQPEIYMPFQQHPYHANELQIIARTPGDPSTLEPAVRRIMHRLAPNVATDFTTFSAMISESVAAPRFRATLAVTFAAIAALLAMSGIYAVIAYYVTQRRAEIGIRMALGARPLSIGRMVLFRSLQMTGFGLVIGIFGAIGLSRFVETLVYGIGTMDPLTYLLGALAVLLTTVVAIAGPMWRASRVNPAAALKDE